MKQLSFQLSSIYEVKIIRKKINTELLEKADGDYKFILRLINNKNAENFPKIRQMFRIYSVDKNEALNFKEKYLYLNGVKADEVKYVLTNGYPNNQNSLKEFEPVLCKAKTNLSLATRFGCSYSEVDNTVKKLSFVFVVCSKDNYEDQKEDKMMKNSRKSVTKEEKFGNFEYWSDKNRLDLVPAHLIIFELDDL